MRKNPDVSVGVLVLDKGRILLVLNKEEPNKVLPSGRSFYKPSKWGLPTGRGEPEDEDSMDTAARETLEETGLFVEVDERTRIVEQAETHLNVGFVGYPVGGSLRPNSEEILDCRWFPVRVLRNPDLLKKILGDNKAEMHIGHLRRAQKLFEIVCSSGRNIGAGKYS